MAKIKAYGNLGYDIEQIDFSDLYHGVKYVSQGTVFRVFYDDGTVDQFKGSGLRYDSDGVPTGGTIKSYSFSIGDSKVVTIDGFSIAITKVVKAAQTASTSDDMALIKKALSGNDSISGSNGPDNALGYNGNDTINGNGGDDTLNGGKGNDRLTGGSGADLLIGEAGADTFTFLKVSDSMSGSSDTIQDFSRAQKDRIDLSAIDAIQATTRNDKFSFIGDAEFSGAAGELRYAKSGGYTFIEGDVDGNGVADLVIRAVGEIDFVAKDFAL